ncbi:hypothetical protein D3C75_902380 [compost metagenome]
MNADKGIGVQRRGDLHSSGEGRLLIGGGPRHLHLRSPGFQIVAYIKGRLQRQILLHRVVGCAEHARIAAAMPGINDDQFAADPACRFEACARDCTDHAASA